MYIVPGYVEENQKDEKIELKSNINGNIVAISEKKFINEYINLKKSGSKHLKSEIELFLHEHGFLCSENEIESSISIFRKLLDQKLVLTIMPTEDCNFDCGYCYEEHIKSTMDDKVIKGIMKYIHEQLPTISILHINWFGGEPTLCKKQINQISEFILDEIKEQEQQIAYQASMTTNGYLLDVESFKSYVEQGISTYQITLDGKDHDKNRCLRGGKGSYQRIVQNLTAISKLPPNIDFHITIRRNILPNEDLHWYDSFVQLIHSDSRFSFLVRAVSDFGGTRVKALNILSDDEKEEEINRHVRYIQSLGMLVENEAPELEYKMYCKVCYAAHPKGFVIRVNGNLEKCSICLGNEKNVVGHVNDSFDIDQRKNSEWCSVPLDTACLKCKSLLICNNLQCPQRSLLAKNKTVCGMEGNQV